LLVTPPWRTFFSLLQRLHHPLTANERTILYRRFDARDVMTKKNKSKSRQKNLYPLLQSAGVFHLERLQDWAARYFTSRDVGDFGPPVTQSPGLAGAFFYDIFITRTAARSGF
jgi:hypothetical protein